MDPQIHSQMPYVSTMVSSPAILVSAVRRSAWKMFEGSGLILLPVASFDYRQNGAWYSDLRWSRGIAFNVEIHDRSVPTLCLHFLEQGACGLLSSMAGALCRLDGGIRQDGAYFQTRPECVHLSCHYFRNCWVCPLLPLHPKEQGMSWGSSHFDELLNLGLS